MRLDKLDALAQMWSFTAVLHLLLCLVFVLCERKKRDTDTMASTMLPQAKGALCVHPKDL